MSVINQMLQDLEQRQGSAKAKDAAVIADSSRGRTIVLFAVLAISAAVGGAWYLGLFSAQPQALAEATPADSEPKFEAHQTTTQLNEPEIKAKAEQPAAQPTKAMVNAQQPSSAQPSLQNIEKSAPAEKSQAQVVAKTAVKPQEENLAAKPTAAQQPGLVEQTVVRAPVASKAPQPKPASPKTASMSVKPAAPNQTKPKASALRGDPSREQMSVTPVSLTPPERVALYRRQAKQAMDSGDPVAATKALEKVLSLETSAYADRIQLATLYFANQQTAKAAELLRQGIEQMPENPELRLAMARLYIKQEAIDQAWYFLSGVTPDINQYREYFATLAGVAQRRGDNLAARDTYAALVEIAPSQGRWWLGLAIAQDRLGEYQQARTSYLRSANQDISNSLRKFAEQRAQELEQ